MTAASHNFTTPVGRLVGGDVFTARDKDFDGRPLTTRDGKPRAEYIIQVAFPKTDVKTNEMLQQIYRIAQEAFPTMFQNGQCIVPTFSFKWQDGDSQIPNMRGTKPAEREGFPGHWVLTFKSSFAPKVYGQNHEPITDANAIKRGDWVRVGVTCRGNDQQSKPGVYLNHSMLQLCGYGEAIQSGPDAATVFAEPYQLPAGASATPVAPAGVAPGGAPTPGAPPPGAPAMPPGVGAPVAPPVAAPPPGVAQAPTPAPGFGAPSSVPPMPAPGAAPAPGAPPAPPAKQTVAGCPHTYEALVAAGWSDDQMRQAGYLA